jgi:hypothetical protein
MGMKNFFIGFVISSAVSVAYVHYFSKLSHAQGYKEGYQNQKANCDLLLAYIMNHSSGQKTKVKRGH